MHKKMKRKQNKLTKGAKNYRFFMDYRVEKMKR
jgi:hypothetical protein